MDKDAGLANKEIKIIITLFHMLNKLVTWIIYLTNLHRLKKYIMLVTINTSQT